MYNTRFEGNETIEKIDTQRSVTQLTKGYNECQGAICDESDLWSQSQKNVHEHTRMLERWFEI